MVKGLVVNFSLESNSFGGGSEGYGYLLTSLEVAVFLDFILKLGLAVVSL